jgi:hypothetical protein
MDKQTIKLPRLPRLAPPLSSNSNKVPVVVKASKVEVAAITADRSELESLL